MSADVTPSRRVITTVRGMPASDGAGVKLNRLIGQPALDMLDPFLMLDEFRSDQASDYLAGFPDHPHRGFETVTYMLAGNMRHGDNQGNSGKLRAGSVQWMTAGRGIVHSEMPEQEDGLMWGFQLWVNLPAKDKMTAPRYQDIAPEQVPRWTPVDGVELRLLTGRIGETEGPVTGIATAPLYVDVHLHTDARWTATVPEGHNAFVYVYEGSVTVGGGGSARILSRGELGVLSHGERVELASGGAPARCILVAGKPLNEPVAKYGPFVMSTPEQIVTAIRDYQSGRFV
ncbi:MAG: short-chain dehydrogenase [Rhodanobacteraceae bacterium]